MFRILIVSGIDQLNEEARNLVLSATTELNVKHLKLPEQVEAAIWILQGNPSLQSCNFEGVKMSIWLDHIHILQQEMQRLPLHFLLQ